MCSEYRQHRLVADQNPSSYGRAGAKNRRPASTAEGPGFAGRSPFSPLRISFPRSCQMVTFTQSNLQWVPRRAFVIDPTTVERGNEHASRVHAIPSHNAATGDFQSASRPDQIDPSRSDIPHRAGA